MQKYESYTCTQKCMNRGKREKGEKEQINMRTPNTRKSLSLPLNHLPIHLPIYL